MLCRKLDQLFLYNHVSNTVLEIWHRLNQLILHIVNDRAESD